MKKVAFGVMRNMVPVLLLLSLVVAPTGPGGADPSAERETITYVFQVSESVFATSGRLGTVDYSNQNVLSHGHTTAWRWLRTSDIDQGDWMKRFRSFLKFDASSLNALPAASTIDDAALWLYFFGSAYDHPGNASMVVREMTTSNWGEYTLHWGNMPTGIVRVIARGSIPYSTAFHGRGLTISTAHLNRWRQSGEIFSLLLRSNITRSFRSHRFHEGWPHIRLNVSYAAVYVDADRTSSSWSNAPVTVQLSFHDTDGIGIVRRQYAWSQSQVPPSSGWRNVPAGGQVTQSEEGVWYLHVRTEDGSGNINYVVTNNGTFSPVGQGKIRTNNTTVGGAFGPYRIDTTPPEIRFRNPSDSEDFLGRDWDHSSVTVRVKVTDSGGSGYNGTSFLWSENPDYPVGGWSSWVLNADWGIHQAAAGEWYLHVLARDAAGNVAYRYEGPYRVSVENRLRTRIIR